MLKRLIAASALLGVVLLSASASAGGRPSQLDRFDRVGRPAPASIERMRPQRMQAERVQRVAPERAARPLPLERLRPRGDVEVGRMRSRPMRSDAATTRQNNVRNPLEGRVQSRVRCADSTACGSSASRSVERRAMQSQTEQEKDAINQERERLRKERILKMIKAKAFGKAHPGKL